MKSKLIATTAFLALAGASMASVTLSFNAAFSGGVSSNLANQAGVVSNGLFYGVIIDTANNGVLAQYGAIVPALGSSYSLVTTTSTSTDDILILATDTTSNTGTLLEDDFLTPGGNGGVLGVADINLSGGIGAGDKFFLVWLDGNKAGSLTDASFTIPADGSLVDYGAPFVGVDPVRNALSSYVGTSGTPTGVGITFVPEPSAALLGALGALGLLRRRRA